MAHSRQILKKVFIIVGHVSALRVSRKFAVAFLSNIEPIERILQYFVALPCLNYSFSLKKGFSVADLTSGTLAMDSLETLEQSGSGFEERRLERAYRYVNDYWFPPNPELLSKIRAGLKHGQYDFDLKPLVAQIKTDFSIFTYCVRELLHMVRAEQAELPHYSNPIELIEWAGPVRLKKILDVDDHVISRHSFDGIEAVQARRIEEAMISASVAEALSEKRDVDSRLGFSVALLRQLGLTLIAWNYPTVYPEVINALELGKDLDQALSEKLGFSPATLGMAIVRDWGLSPQVRTGLGDAEAYDTLTEAKQRELKVVAETITKICEVGETLARANDPEHYPSAQSDWNTAKQAIEDELGKDGVRLVQARARENCENYLLTMPNLFRAALKVDPPKQMKLEVERKLLKENPFVDQCSAPVRLKIKELYVKINSGPITRENVHMLVKRVVPVAGFTGGCIYTLDPGTATLTTRVRIGDVKLRSFASIDYSRNALSSEAVLDAFSCMLPTTHGSFFDEEESFSYLAGVSSKSSQTEVVYMAGSMGKLQKVGVLYLEVDKELAHDLKFDLLMHFKAIRQALVDCLHLV